jgi:hypothetical protein
MIPKSKRNLKNTSPTVKAPLKLDLGCGPNPRDGFEGVDVIKFTDKVRQLDLKRPWPWHDGSVSEAHCSHFAEHLTQIERCHFFNELYRVLKPVRHENGKPVEGFCTLIVPNWSSQRAYGDPTHCWPPFSWFAFPYLNRQWREKQAPHTDAKNWPPGFNCNFNAVGGFTLNNDIGVMNPERQQFALLHYIEAGLDITATLEKLA